HERLAALEFSTLVAGFDRAAPELPARRTLDGAAGYEHDLIDMKPAQVGDSSTDGLEDAVGPCSTTRLRDDHDAIGAAPCTRSECDEPSAAKAWNIAKRPFKVVRVIIAAVPDDHVLDSPAHKELPLRDISKVPSEEPAVSDGCGREVLVGVVAGHDRRT